MNKEILLKSRPVGKPTAANFEIVNSEPISLNNGDLLLKARYISVDPYMVNATMHPV